MVVVSFSMSQRRCVVVSSARAGVGHGPQGEQHPDHALLHEQRVLRERIGEPLARPPGLLGREAERRATASRAAAAGRPAAARTPAAAPRPPPGPPRSRCRSVPRAAPRSRSAPPVCCNCWSTAGTSGFTAASPSSSTPNSGPMTGSVCGSREPLEELPAAAAAGTAGSWARRSSNGASPAMIHPPTRVGSPRSSARARSCARPAGTRNAEARAATQTTETHHEDAVQRLGHRQPGVEPLRHHGAHDRQAQRAADRPEELRQRGRGAEIGRARPRSGPRSASAP